MVVVAVSGAMVAECVAAVMMPETEEMEGAAKRFRK